MDGQRVRQSTGERTERKARMVEAELKVHTTIEEETFYPAVKETARGLSRDMGAGRLSARGNA